MNKHELPVFAAMLAIMFCFGAAYGQVDDSTGSDDTADGAGPFTLHIPEKMISNSTYSGVVVLAEPAEHDTSITLASTEKDIGIPDFVVIQRGYNHGMFEMVLDEDLFGVIQIHAALSGDLSTATANVYAATESGISLQIVGPSASFDDTIRTQIPRIPIYVYSMNDDNVPIPAAEDIEIRLSSSTDAIRFVYGNSPHSEMFVTMKQGEYSITADVDVRKSGTIYATANGMDSDSEAISYGLDDVEVRIEISPETAGTGSYVHYYVWLEKDGRQYVPASLMDVTMSANDMTVGNFERDFHQKPGRPHNDYIINGMARGIIYTGTEGTVDITASVPQIGSASTELTVEDFQSDRGITMEDIIENHGQCVGGAITTTTTIGNITQVREETCDFYSTVLNTINSAVPITALSISVYPDVPADNAFAVITPSNSITVSDTITTNTVDSSDGFGIETATTIERDATFPTTISPKADIVLSGDGGIEHDRIVSAIDYHTGHFGLSDVSSLEVPIRILSDGDHLLSVHGKGITGSEAEFASESKYGEGEDMHVMQLPIVIGDHGDIAMVFLTDDDGNVVDFSSVIRGDVTAHISQESDTIGNLTENLPIWGSVGIVQGEYTKDDATIFAHIPGFSANPTRMSPTEIPSRGIELWMPDTVHVTEKFPITVHDVDAGGAPLGIPENIRITSQLVNVDERDGQRFATIGFTGEIDVIVVSEDGYLDSGVTETFVNNATAVSIDPIVDFDDIRVGDDIIFDILTGTIVEPMVRFVGELDFMQDERGQYVAVPTEPGTYDVKVRLIGDGSVPYEESHEFVVREFVRLTYDVITDDGVPIDAPMVFTDAQAEENKTATLYELRDGADINNVKLSLYGVTVPESVDLGDDRIYTLSDLKINDQSVKFSKSFTMPIFENMDIVSVYVREINVDFFNSIDSEVESVLDNTDTDGSGNYRYGDTVFLEAPILYEYGIIRHVPAEWTGLPADAAVTEDGTLATFEALSSTSGSVEYMRDYTILYGIVAAAVIAAPLIIRIRSPHAFADLFHNLKNLKIPKVPKIRGKGK